MSGPQDIQNGLKMLGMGGGAGGPPPNMPIGQTKKRLGDERVPMSTERPRMNPGQQQDRAARQMNVPNYQVQPQTRPSPPTQAPSPPTLPKETIPLPRSRPEDAPLPPEINPSAMANGGIPMPRGRPEGAGPRGPVTGDPGQLNRMVSAVLEKMMGGGMPSDVSTLPKGPPSTFGNSFFNMVGGLMKPAGSNSSATAAPSPLPPSDPFKTGAPGVQPGIEQLMPIIAQAAKAKAEQERPPVQAPQSTRPSPNVTPPVPPGQPPQPPPSVQPPLGREGNPDDYKPSTPTFKGYEIRPPKAKKGDEKHKEQALDKGNNLYYYTRIGVMPGDKSGVAQRVREIRAKASNPRTAKNMTPEEDRILAQYADHAVKEGDFSLLMPMDPETRAARMQQYKSGAVTGQIPDRYEARPPGVEPGDGARTPLKLPPKSQDKKLDKAEKDAYSFIQNPPKKDTDPDKDEPVDD